MQKIAKKEMKKNIEKSAIKLEKITVTGLLWSLFAGIVAAGGEALGCFSPFALALFSCRSLVGKAAVFIGTVIGSFAYGRTASMLPYTAAMLVLIILEFAFAYFGLRANLRLKTVLSTVLVAVFDLLISDFLIEGAFGILLILIDAALVGGCVVLFDKLKGIFNNGSELFCITGKNAVPISLGFILACTLLSAYGLWLFNFGIAFGAFAVIYLSTRRGFSVCVMAAGLATIGICLFSPEMASVAVVLMGTAFLCPACASFGKTAQALSALLASLLSMLLLGVDLTTFSYVLDVSLAMAIFSFAKDRELYYNASNSLSYISSMPSSLASGRLLVASGVMEDIKGSIEQASNILEHETPRDVSWVSDRAADSVCKKCKNNLACWQEHYDETAKAMSATAYGYCKKSSITTAELPSYLKENCIKCSEVASEMNRFHEIYKNETRASRCFSDMRNILSGQLESTRLLLKQLGEEISSCTCTDKAKSREIEELFQRSGMKNARATVCVNSSGKVQIEGYALTEPTALSLSELHAEIEKRFDMRFDTPQIYKVHGQIRIFAGQSAKLRAEVKTARKSKQRVSGDTSKSFCDGRGNAFVCLSDGMGSGERASVDSSLACKLITNLLKSGVEAKTAVKIANAGLFVKSADESFATLDILKIDLLSAKGEFVKAGSAPSYIKKRDSVIKIDGASLPIGMLDKVAINVREVSLKKGDIIVMVSDGAVQSQTDWILPLLRKTDEADPEALAAMICDFAKAAEESEDDITVIVIALEENL